MYFAMFGELENQIPCDSDIAIYMIIDSYSLNCSVQNCKPMQCPACTPGTI